MHKCAVGYFLRVAASAGSSETGNGDCQLISAAVVDCRAGSLEQIAHKYPVAAAAAATPDFRWPTKSLSLRPR